MELNMVSRDKANKFVDLANKRVNRTIKHLRLIKNLSNRKNYTFTDEQARKIVKALQKEVDSIKQSFQDEINDEQNNFKL